MTPLSPELKQQIADALNAGDLPMHVATRFGVNPVQVRSVQCVLDYCPHGSPNCMWRVPGRNNQMRQAINRLWAGEDPQAIADRLGLPLSRVLVWQKKYPKPQS